MRYQEDKKITLVFLINKNLLYVNENDWIIKYPFNDFGTIIVMSDNKFNYFFNIEE